MKLYFFLAGALGILALCVVCIRIGMKLEHNVIIEADLKRADRVIVKVQKERVIETKYVTRWMKETQTIVVNATEEKNEIQTFVRPDCVLPPDVIVQLHAISRNTTVKALGLTEDAGKGADCRSALEALRQSYANHYADSEQLNTILDRETELDALEKIR